MDLDKIINIKNIRVHLEGRDKAGVLKELVDMLAASGEIDDAQTTLDAIWKRENLMSTGLQNGVATPNAKTDSATSMKVAIGLKPEGIEFDALDGQPSRIFVLLLSPAAARGPHVEFLAEIARRLKDDDSRARLLQCSTPEAIREIFIH